MPQIKNRQVFISHAWQYSSHYDTICEWLDEANNFTWKNCSVPSTNALPDKTSTGLSRGMTRQINPSNVVLILGGMYAAHSAWIEYEISEAQRLNKVIIGITPWGQERVPIIVQEASVCPMVGWNRASVIQAIRDYS